MDMFHTARFSQQLDLKRLYDERLMWRGSYKTYVSGHRCRSSPLTVGRVLGTRSPRESEHGESDIQRVTSVQG